MAQLDASIPLGVKPFQMPDQMNSLAKLMQLQAAQQQVQVGGMEMEKHRNALARTSRLQDLVARPYDTPEARENALLQGGFIDEASKLGKDRRENLKLDSGIAKDRKDAEKIDFDMEIKKVEHISSALSTARDPASYEGVRQYIGRTFGEKALTNLPPQFDPAALQGIIATGQTITQRLTDERQRQQIAETGRHNAATERISVENNQRTVGASYANAGATRAVAEATRDAAKIKDNRDTEMKLADDYRAQSKDFKSVVDAANRVRSALPSATKSAAATLTAATSFMKMLDPGSVVRESELGMALAATGAIDRLTNYHNVLQNGKVLTASQVKDFESITNKVLEAAKQGQQAVDGNYRRQAQQYNLRPEMIVQDLGQGGGASTAILDKADAILRGGK